VVKISMAAQQVKMVKFAYSLRIGEDKHGKLFLQIIDDDDECNIQVQIDGRGGLRRIYGCVLDQVCTY
jgi:hypothetical protein